MIFTRTINLRFLAVFLAILAALCTGVHFLHAYQLKRNTHALKEHADQAWEDLQGLTDPTEREQKRNEALEYYNLYLGYERDHPDEDNFIAARARQGMLLDDKVLAARRKASTNPRTRQGAFNILEDAVRRRPDQFPDQRRRLIEIALDLRRYADAKTHLEYLLKESPQDADLESQIARCDAVLTHYDLAAKGYEQAIRHDPRRVEDYYQLALLLRRQLNQAATANRVINDMVEANPESYRAYLIRADYSREYRRTKDDEKVLLKSAGDDVQTALEKAPNEADTILAAASVAGWEKKDVETARRLLERGLKLHSKSAKAESLYLALASLELARGDRQKGLGYLREGVQAVPDSFDLLWGLAAELVYTGQRDEAQKLLAVMKKKGFLQEHLDYLNARLKMQQGHWQEASFDLERIFPYFDAWSQSPRQPDPFRRLATVLTREANLSLGACYEQMGDPERQLQAYNRALKADPTSAAVRASRAAVLSLLGRYDDALNDLNDYQESQRIAGRTDEGAAINLARLQLLRNLRLPAAAPRDWAAVERELAKAEKARPGSVPVIALRAELLVAQGKFDDARAILEKAVAKEPKGLELWVTLTNVYLLLKDPKKAVETLDKAQQQVGDTALMRLARVTYWARQNPAEARPALAKLAEDTAKFPEEERARLLMAAGEAFTRIGDAPEAERMWLQVADLRKQDLKARMVLFDFYLASGNEAKMANLIKDIKQLEGDGALGRYAEAARLITLARAGDKRVLGQARTRLTEAAGFRPDWARIPLLQSELETLEGNTDRAIEDLQKAVDLGDLREPVVKRLVLMLNERRRYDEAQRVLARLEHQIGELGSDLNRMVAAITLDQDPERAQKYIDKAVPVGSKDFRDQLWRGQMLVNLKPPKVVEAELAFREAVLLAPKVPYPWISLVRFFARTNQKGKGEQALEEARKNLPPEQAPLALAYCYDALEKGLEADKQYQAALAARPGDPAVIRAVADFYVRTGRFAKAEPLLNKLLDAETRATAPDVTWTRRTLAMATGLGDYRQFQNALRLLEKNAQAGVLAPDDLRTKAVLYALRNYRSARREAITMLEDLNRKRPLSAGDRYLLAELHDTEGNWPRAQELLTAIIQEKQNNPVFLARLAVGLIRNNPKPEAAEPWVKQLEALQPNAFATVELKARLAKKKGNGFEAISLLRDYGQKAGADLHLIAALLEDLEEYQAAEEFYEKYVFRIQQPENVLLYAQFLGRRKQPEKALAICERAWQNCNPEAVGAACVAIVYLSGSDERHTRRVSRWLEDQLKDRPRSTGLLMQLADLRNLQGNFTEAEKLYRDVLKLEPNHRTALNNLAWLLAFQEGKREEALDLVQKAIDLAGPVAELIDTRGIVVLLRGDASKALIDLQEAAATPTASRSFHLALAHHKMNNRVAAADALKKAKELGLTPDKLHGLERPLYEKLLADMQTQ